MVPESWFLCKSIMLRYRHSLSSRGMDSEKRLEERFSEARLERLPMLLGIGPERELEERSRVCRSEQLAMEGDRVPARLENPRRMDTTRLLLQVMPSSMLDDGVEHGFASNDGVHWLNFPPAPPLSSDCLTPIRQLVSSSPATATTRKMNHDSGRIMLAIELKHL